MLLRRISPFLLLAFLAVSVHSANLKRERREAVFGSLVGSLASPFINFKRGVLNLLTGSKAEKKPSSPAKKPTYGAPAPSYNAPAPSYNAPAPSYNAPAPSYNPPAPSYQPAPAPSYNAPAPAQSYQSSAPVYEPPAPKPQIYILPAPDLSQSAPAPAVDTYGSPAAAPAVDTYGSPSVSTYDSPILTTYVVEPAAEPPVYEPAVEPPVFEPAVEPPVYEPATYDPAPVDIDPIPKIIETAPQVIVEIVPEVSEPVPPVIVEIVPEVSEPAPPVIVEIVPEVSEPAVVDIIDLKDVVELRESEALIVDLSPELETADQSVPEVDEPRAPKAFSNEQPALNQLPVVEEKPVEEIIIDLTDPVEDTIITTEKSSEESIIQETEVTEKALVIEEEDIIQPSVTKIITFEAAEVLPAISGPVQSSNEVISFTPVQDIPVKNINFFPVESVDSDPQVDTFTAAPAQTDAAQDTTTSETTVSDTIITETVTPIVPNQELRSLVVELDSSPVEVADIEVTTDDVEIIDLRTDKKSSGLTLVDHDENHPEIFVVVDETTTTVLPITTQSQEVIDLQEEDDVDYNLIETETEGKAKIENEGDAKIENEPIEEEINPTQEPTHRQVTFKILSDDEAQNVNPDVTFRIIDASEEEEGSNFDTFRVQETTVAPEEDEASTNKAGNVLTEVAVGSPGEIPAVIETDPAFQELVSSADESDIIKRGYNAYDPRHSRVYAHKYNDNYSNWYYFRKGY